MATMLKATIIVAPSYPRKVVAQIFKHVAKQALGLDPVQIKLKIKQHGSTVEYPDPKVRQKFYGALLPISFGDFVSMFFDELSVLVHDFTPEQSSFYKFLHGDLWTGSNQVGLRVSSINAERYAVKIDQNLLAKKEKGDDTVLPYQLHRERGVGNEWDKVGEPQPTFEACRDLAFEDAG